jgi:hypothetical protein
MIFRDIWVSEVARLAILVRPEAGTIGSQIDDIRGIASGVASKEEENFCDRKASFREVRGKARETRPVEEGERT